MESINLRRHYSRNTLFRMIIIAVAFAALMVWKFDLVYTVYFKDQLTQIGLIINGAIILLFVIGLLRTIGILLSYMREEGALERFVRNVERRPITNPFTYNSTDSAHPLPAPVTAC